MKSVPDREARPEPVADPATDEVAGVRAQHRADRDRHIGHVGESSGDPPGAPAGSVGVQRSRSRGQRAACPRSCCPPACPPSPGPRTPAARMADPADLDEPDPRVHRAGPWATSPGPTSSRRAPARRAAPERRLAPDAAAANVGHRADVPDARPSRGRRGSPTRPPAGRPASRCSCGAGWRRRTRVARGRAARRRRRPGRTGTTRRSIPTRPGSRPRRPPRGPRGPRPSCGSSFIVAMSSAIPGVSLSLPSPAAAIRSGRSAGAPSARRTTGTGRRTARRTPSRPRSRCRRASSPANCATFAAFTTRAGRPTRAQLHVGLDPDLAAGRPRVERLDLREVALRGCPPAFDAGPGPAPFIEPAARNSCHAASTSDGPQHVRGRLREARCAEQRDLLGVRCRGELAERLRVHRHGLVGDGEHRVDRGDGEADVADVGAARRGDSGPSAMPAAARWPRNRAPSVSLWRIVRACANQRSVASVPVAVAAAARPSPPAARASRRGSRRRRERRRTWPRPRPGMMFTAAPPSVMIPWTRASVRSCWRQSPIDGEQQDHARRARCGRATGRVDACAWTPVNTISASTDASSSSCTWVLFEAWIIIAASTPSNSPSSIMTCLPGEVLLGRRAQEDDLARQVDAPRTRARSRRRHRPRRSGCGRSRGRGRGARRTRRGSATVGPVAGPAPEARADRRRERARRVAPPRSRAARGSRRPARRRPRSSKPGSGLRVDADATGPTISSRFALTASARRPARASCAAVWSGSGASPVAAWVVGLLIEMSFCRRVRVRMSAVLTAIEGETDDQEAVRAGWPRRASPTFPEPELRPGEVLIAPAYSVVRPAPRRPRSR